MDAVGHKHNSIAFLILLKTKIAQLDTKNQIVINLMELLTTLAPGKRTPANPCQQKPQYQLHNQQHHQVTHVLFANLLALVRPVPTMGLSEAAVLAQRAKCAVKILRQTPQHPDRDLDVNHLKWEQEETPFAKTQLKHFAHKIQLYAVVTQTTVPDLNIVVVF